MLRRVVCCESSFGALGLQERCKVVASVLPSAVRPESFDLRAVLSARPVCKGFVGLQSLVLGPKELEAGEAGMVVSESDVIFAAAQARGRRGPPDVSMHLVTKRGC